MKIKTQKGAQSGAPGTLKEKITCFLPPIALYGSISIDGFFV
jgi:hypothetical protein